MLSVQYANLALSLSVEKASVALYHFRIKFKTLLQDTWNSGIWSLPASLSSSLSPPTSILLTINTELPVVSCTSLCLCTPALAAFLWEVFLFACLTGFHPSKVANVLLPFRSLPGTPSLPPSPPHPYAELGTSP